MSASASDVCVGGASVTYDASDVTCWGMAGVCALQAGEAGACKLPWGATCCCASSCVGVAGAHASSVCGAGAAPAGGVFALCVVRAGEDAICGGVGGVAGVCVAGAAMIRAAFDLRAAMTVGSRSAVLAEPPLAL